MRQTGRAPKLHEKTDFQMARDKRDLELYIEYNRLASNPEQSKAELNKYLMQKYGIHSAATIYAIRQRVAKRLMLKN